MPTIFIDHQPYTIPEGDRNLLDVCLSLGFDIPYFCWHPAIHSVGACRLCAVKRFKDESDAAGTLVMSCMTPASDGTRISINDPEAVEFRRKVIEWLMVNHPHDCPVCDEGGECHLQDMTVMAGHVRRRYRFTKRTHKSQNLGPFVAHEMNRCIQCYRCVRFYSDYAGGRDLNVFGWHDDVYFGRHADGALESEFSGNLVEVCPTGVFTDKTLKRHYTRKWDLTSAPSVCVHCALGCNTFAGERYGMLRRILNRYHGEINRYFLCDRGRFGYEFVNGSRRIRRPLVGGKEVTKADALARMREILASGRAIAIGSPRATVETNYALRKLVGADRFNCGLSERDSRLAATALNILRTTPAMIASLAEVERCDAALVLGEDVTNTAPMLALALRQTARQRPIAEALKLGVHRWDDANLRNVAQRDKGTIFIATVDATKLDDIAAKTFRGSPDDLPRLAEEAFETLRAADRPLIVAGTSLGSEALLTAADDVAARLAKAGKSPRIALVLPECNSLGLAMIGGGSLESAAESLRAGKADTLVIAENDITRRAPKALVDELFRLARHVIVIDHTSSATSERAEIVLPAATFAECAGTLVNNEGRAQRYFQVFAPEGDIQAAWRWVQDSPGLDELLDSIERELPQFALIKAAAPAEDFRAVGQKIPRRPHRWTGHASNTANISVHEPKPPADPDAPMAFSSEGFEGHPPSALNPRYWAPGWNSVQAVSRYQSEASGPLLAGDPGVLLIRPGEPHGALHSAQAPAAFTPRNGELLVVPSHHIFGSEELSAGAEGIREAAPAPAIALNPADAARLGLRAGDAARVTIGDVATTLAAQVHDALLPGIATMPASSELPAWAKVARASKEPQ